LWQVTAVLQVSVSIAMEAAPEKCAPVTTRPNPPHGKKIVGQIATDDGDVCGYI